MNAPLECSSMQTICSGIESAHIRLIFFFFEETYTLTKLVDQKLRFSVYSKSTHDSFIWLRFFDLSQLFKKYRTCRSFSVLKIVTGYRPYSHSLFCYFQRELNKGSQYYIFCCNASLDL